jgi:hypothetical protein
MRFKEGLVLRKVLGQNLVSGEGLDKVNYSRMVKLNDSAAFLWKSVSGKDFTVETLADLLVGEYGIDAETARRDSEAIAAKWKEIGLIEE